MQIPNQVKVGYLTYTVHFVPEVVWHGRHIPAHTDHFQARIEIATKYNKQIQEQAFAHELLHALIFVSGVKPGLKNEERLVAHLAPAFYQLLDENGFNVITYHPGGQAEAEEDETKLRNRFRD